MSRKGISIWCSTFTKLCMNLQDESCVCHSYSLTTEDNTAHIEALIQKDKCHKFCDMCVKLDPLIMKLSKDS